MKKNATYIILGLVIAVTLSFIYYTYSNKEKASQNEVYALQPRKGSSAETEEWKNTQLRAAKLLRTIQSDTADNKSFLALASLFVQEARITGNYAYYDKAAMKYVNDVLKNDPDNFEAMVLQSVIYLSQHHFAEGLATANKIVAINPYSSYVYGLLVDGDVEMGNYDSAVSHAERMINIRPDIRSYSRVSYLREIHGDYPGAIEAMKLAVEAGTGGDEATEWARIQLGHLYENTGDTANAAMHYAIALSERPGYAYALAGMARLSLAAKDYQQAIRYYQQADSSVTDFSVKEGLAEAYALAGDKTKSTQLQQDVITEMNSEAKAGNTDENIGHYVDRELAYAYLNVQDYDKALDHALLEYNRRPANIDVNEAVAWVYYQRGEYANALPYIKAALKTNSKNPTLLCRAGLIFAKTGDKTTARLNLQTALQHNPLITDNLKAESMRILQTL